MSREQTPTYSEDGSERDEGMSLRDVLWIVFGVVCACGFLYATRKALYFNGFVHNPLPEAALKQATFDLYKWIALAILMLLLSVATFFYAFRKR